jgi:hypothetical protein
MYTHEKIALFFSSLHSNGFILLPLYIHIASIAIIPQEML